MDTLKKIGFPLIFKLLLCCTLLFGLYYSTLSFLLSRWQHPDYNYCYLIPFIVIYLIWEKRASIAQHPSRPEWKGFFLFIMGILFFWLGELGGEYYTLFISLWIVIVGYIWMQIGWEKIKLMAFPLILAITMFPFPNFINNKFSLYLRLISSRIGVSILHIFNFPAYREGNIIDLGFVELQVVDACSGLRYLFPLLILSVLVAYFSKMSFWKKVVLVLSMLPLSIFTNSFRIALTGIIYKFWGAEFAEGFFHGFSGWLIFIFSFLVLIFEVWILRKMAFEKDVTAFSHKPVEPAFSRAASADNGHKNILPSDLLRLHFIIPVTILLLTFFISSGMDFREKMPLKKSFDAFPMGIGPWEGNRQNMDIDVLTSLDLSDYIIADYIDKTGDNINLYIAYYESQRKGKSIHSPETCIPGSGWSFDELGYKTITFDDSRKGKIKIKHALIQKGNTKQIAYYWFSQRGRILTNAFQLKIYAFYDAITTQRTDGALVRFIAPVKNGEDIDTTEKRLDDFVRLVMPILNEYIPS